MISPINLHNRVFSTIDLKSAYHQVKIKDADKPFTAFEADGLYQFKRIPFGVTNGVASFQRIMNEIINSEKLSNVYVYLDNIYICGRNQAQHDENIKKWNEVKSKYNVTYNEDKCLYSITRLCVLGHVIEDGCIKPAPERLRPLRELPVPVNGKGLKRILGMFSYYSHYIPKFSDKIALLASTNTFPLSEAAVEAFENLKLEIEQSVVSAVDEALPFEIETDASDIVVLNQGGRPVAFFLRKLQGLELHHPPVEKEASAIVEAVRHWRHYLNGRRFTVRTVQQSVAYIFDKVHQGKIKNDKITRWKIELSCYVFDITYHPGKDNTVADTFTPCIVQL